MYHVSWWVALLTVLGRRLGSWLRQARILPVTVEGCRYWQSVPQGRALIVAPNHIGAIDAMVLQLVLPQPARFLGQYRTLVSRLGSWYFRAAGHLPVDEEDAELNLRSLLDARHVLALGGCLAVFGEGEYKKGADRLLPYSQSVAQLALLTGALVIPVGLHGTPAVTPWLDPHQRPRWLQWLMRHQRPRWAGPSSGGLAAGP